MFSHQFIHRVILNCSLYVLCATAVYQCIVHSLYNVQLVQFAVSLTHQLTVDERLCWQSLGQQSTCRDLELLVCRVLETFDRMSLSTPDDCASDAGLPAVCSRIHYSSLITYSTQLNITERAWGRKSARVVILSKWRNLVDCQLRAR